MPAAPTPVTQSNSAVQAVQAHGPEISEKRVLFVMNPSAGKKKKVDWKAEIEKFYGSHNELIRVMIMPKRDCGQRLIQEIEYFRPHRIVAVGGDGTVTFVATHLLGKQTEMAILPAGSANGMAKELQIPNDPAQAIGLAVNGSSRPTDVVCINKKHICLHLSDVGLNAQLIKYFQEGKIRGMFGYVLALAKALRRRADLRVAVHTKNAEVIRTAVMVIIANATRYGTGARINPQGSIYDGEFEVVIVREISLLEVLKTFLQFRRFNPHKIEVHQARRTTIETQRKVHFQIDGEYMGKFDTVDAEIMPGKLRLVAP